MRSMRWAIGLAVCSLAVQTVVARAPDSGHGSPADQAPGHETSDKPSDKPVASSGAHSHDAPTDSSSASGHHAAPSISPDEAQSQLFSGNLRFMEGAVVGPRRDEARRCDTFANGQHPVAAVLSCADSRVPVELIFDQGVGDLFVLRVAGNIADTFTIGSIEYGVEHLGIPLIVVMGHSKCGAVKAAIDGAQADGPLGELLKDIAPAALETKAKSGNLPPAAMMSAAVRANVKLASRNLTLRSKVINTAVREGRVKIVGAVYDIHSGNVIWLDGTPSLSAEPIVYPSAPASPSPTPRATPSDSHDSHDSNSDSPSHSSSDKPDHGSSTHGQPKSTEDPHATTPTTQSSAATEKRDNWLVLGSMLAGSMGLSVGVIQWLGKKKGK